MPADPTPPALPGAAAPGSQPTRPPPSKSPNHGCLIAAIVVGVILLLAIAGIAVLAGIAVPAISSIKKKMKKDQARSLAISVVNSCKGYYAEYQRYPLPTEGADAESLPVRSDDGLTGILLGSDVARNPKKINFLPDLKPVQRGRGPGLLTAADGGASVVDPWGEHFYLLMDTDHSTAIENPNAHSTISKVLQSVLVYSAGPDKDPSSWEDNVSTWNNAHPHPWLTR